MKPEQNSSRHLSLRLLETSKDIETKRMQVIASKEEAEASALSWKEDAPIMIGATAREDLQKHGGS